MKKSYNFQCILFQEPHDWSAICLDLSLRVRGQSAAEVRARLEALICDYVSDYARTGSDLGTSIPRPVPLDERLDSERRALLSRLGQLFGQPERCQRFVVRVFHNGYKVPSSD